MVERQGKTTGLVAMEGIRQATGPRNTLLGDKPCTRNSNGLESMKPLRQPVLRPSTSSHPALACLPVLMGLKETCWGAFSTAEQGFHSHHSTSWLAAPRHRVNCWFPVCLSPLGHQLTSASRTDGACFLKAVFRNLPRMLPGREKQLPPMELPGCPPAGGEHGGRRYRTRPKWQKKLHLLLARTESYAPHPPACFSHELPSNA
mmetsp:Transcript_32088/g.90991  ORF Transcript_32088/g.90991 Transcript_32088/m.90991 type:complete len:203 (+) Transcript_32088:853-1461(+)